MGKGKCALLKFIEIIWIRAIEENFLVFDGLVIISQDLNETNNNQLI